MGLSLAYQHTHWHSYARCCSCRSYLLSGHASPQGLKHQALLYGRCELQASLWRTPAIYSSLQLSNDLATIKAFQPLGKGKARVWRMDDEVMCPDPSSRKWTTSQKLQAQENSPSFSSLHHTQPPNSLPGEEQETVLVYELIHYILSSDTHKKSYSALLPLPKVLDILGKWRDADAVKHSSWAFACLAFLHKQFRLCHLQGRREKKQEGYVTRGECCNMINRLYDISRGILGGTLRRSDYQYKQWEPIKLC